MEKQGTNLRPLYSLREPISTSQVLPSALTRLKPLAGRGRGPTSAAPSQRERGPAGVTNPELNGLCLRYGARIFELRRRLRDRDASRARGRIPVRSGLGASGAEAAADLRAATGARTSASVRGGRPLSATATAPTVAPERAHSGLGCPTTAESAPRKPDFYVRLPARFLKDTAISAKAKLLRVILGAFADGQTGRAYVGGARIESLMQCGRAAREKAQRELCTAGWLRLEWQRAAHGRFARRVYVLAEPP